MADSGKSTQKESSESWVEAGIAKPAPLSESQQPDSTLESAGEDESSRDDEIFKSVLAMLPPVQQWCRATIETLIFDVNGRHPTAEWEGESEWTRRLINAILASKKGWDWHRLKTCSNTDYFSLSTHVSHKINSLYSRSVNLLNNRQLHYSTRSSIVIPLIGSRHAIKQAAIAILSVYALLVEI